MPSERPTAAAGSFYPDDPDTLASSVERLLSEAHPSSIDGRLVALVVPHAGYPYSGPVAASAYALLRDAEAARVVVAGPAHFAPLVGSAVPATETWATPLGSVAVDAELRRLAAEAGSVVDDEPHAPEHAVEVQLPFLRVVLGDRLSVLPLAIGSASPGEVADVFDALRPEADLLIVSTDLSHYLEHDRALALDRATADAVCAPDPGGVADDAACGVFALRGLVELARRSTLEVTLLDLRTSAHTAGDPSRVVGYGSFVASERVAEG